VSFKQLSVEVVSCRRYCSNFWVPEKDYEIVFLNFFAPVIMYLSQAII